MRYALSIIILSLLLVNMFAWSDGIWQTPSLPTMKGPRALCFRDVYFVGPQQGWVVGYSLLNESGFIAHTSGNGWQTQFRASQFDPEAVQFLTNVKGWVAGNRRIGDKETEGILLSTEDGGIHWSERHQFPWNIYQMQFVTERNGWAIGRFVDADGTSNSVILATKDGGENWTLQYEGRNEILSLDLCFTDVNNGWALGWSREQEVYKSLLLHTTDGGENWVPLPVGHPLVGEWIAAIDFISASEGWSVLD